MSSLAAESEPRRRRQATSLAAEGLLRRRAAQFPDAPALADPSRALLYREADACIDALACFLIALGLVPGDRVAVELANTIQAPLTLLAAWRAGLTVCALPMVWGRAEITKAVAELEPRALIGGKDQVERLRDIAAETLSVRFVLGFGADLPDGVIGLDEVALQHAGAQPVEARPLTGPALVTFTARADAPLLPVFHAERELLAQGAMTVMALSLSRRDTILNPYPLSGITGVALGLMPWLVSGAALLQHQPFDRDLFVRQMFDGNATVTALPPALLADLAQDGVLADPACKLKRLGCAWPPAELAGPPSERIDPGVSLFDFYPLGDLAGFTRPRAAGDNPAVLPLGEVVTNGKLGDSERFLQIELGAGRGEVMLRGPIVPRGSAAGPLAPDAGGFVATGLRGKAEGDSRFRLCRDPEILNAGGVMVAAAELDGLYRSAPGVLDAACFALPDPIVGERIFVAAVPQGDHTVWLESLHAFLQLQGVAPYKFPDGLAFVPAIPRSADGRVLRDALPPNI